MKKEELERDISVALKFLYKVELTEEERTIYDKIYPWSNEAIYRYCDYYNLEDKNVLTITASMDHALYAIANGAKKIDCTDRNKLCKYYAALKVALIRAYDEQDFFSHFQDRGRRLITSKLNLSEIKQYLTKEQLIFWEEITNTKGFKKNRLLFRTDGFPHKFMLDYKLLKENIENTKIRYFDEDIRDFKIGTKRKYDVIFLSNIIEWEIRSEEKTNMYNSAYDLLKQNGVIYDACVKRNVAKTFAFNTLEDRIYIPPSVPKLETPCKKGVLIYRKK